MSGASDPRVLLDAMNSMLGEFGDIKGPQEVVTIIRYPLLLVIISFMQMVEIMICLNWVFFMFSLMKDAEKMLSRFTFLNILRATIEIAAENSAALETIHK